MFSFSLLSLPQENCGPSSRNDLQIICHFRCHVRPLLRYIQESSHIVCIKRGTKPRPFKYLCIIITIHTKAFTFINIAESPVYLTCPYQYLSLTTDDVILSTAAGLCLYSQRQIQSESEIDTVWARLSAGD